MTNPKLDEVRSWLIKVHQIWDFVLIHLPDEARLP